MTKRKNSTRSNLPAPEYLDHNALIQAVYHAFADSLPPGLPKPICEIPDRRPLEILILIFEEIEWEEIPFDPDVHGVPIHPPSGDPFTFIAGCTCAICRGVTQRPIGWPL